jgi:hypothetical protein
MPQSSYGTLASATVRSFDNYLDAGYQQPPITPSTAQNIGGFAATPPTPAYSHGQLGFESGEQTTLQLFSPIY